MKELNELMAELGDDFKCGQEEFETKLSDCNPTDNKKIIEGLESLGILKLEVEGDWSVFEEDKK